MIKTVIAYDVVEGVNVVEYDDWLVDVHLPDLLANPYVERLSVGTVLRPVRTSSGGASAIANKFLPDRINEIQYADEVAYEKALAWFKENPIPLERGPAGRTNFHFYVLTTEFLVDRKNFPSIDRRSLRPIVRS